MSKRIQGINAGAGISRFSARMIKEYSLDDAGYAFFTGKEEDCFGVFENAVANKEWIVVPLWKPQFLHYRYTIRELLEPKGLLGGVDKAVLLLREDRAEIFSASEIKALDCLCFTNDVIAELDYKVSRENMSIDSVTKNWLDSQ